MRFIAFLIFILPLNSFAGLKEILQKALNTSPEYSTVNDLSEFQNINHKANTSKLYLPTLNFSHTRSKDNAYGSGDIIDSTISRIGLSYTLFNFGKDFHNYKSSKSKLKAYKEESKQSLLNEEEKVLNLIFNYTRTRNELETIKKLIKLKENLNNVAQKKYKNGVISKNDYIRVKVDLSSTRLNLLNKNQSLTSLKNEIRSYGLDLDLLPNQFLLNAKISKSKLQKIKSIKIQASQYPAIAQSQNELIAIDSSLTALKASYFGSFDLSFNRDMYRLQDEEDLYGWSGRITYTLPIFENFSHQTTIAQERAYKIIKQKQLEYTKQSFNEKIKNNYSILKDALATYDLIQGIEDDLDYLLTNLKSRYQRGIISTNDLIQEQDRLLSSQFNIIDTNYQLSVYYISYIHLNGISITNKPEYIFE